MLPAHALSRSSRRIRTSPAITAAPGRISRRNSRDFPGAIVMTSNCLIEPQAQLPRPDLHHRPGRLAGRAAHRPTAETFGAGRSTQAAQGRCPASPQDAAGETDHHRLRARTPCWASADTVDRRREERRDPALLPRRRLRRRRAGPQLLHRFRRRSAPRTPCILTLGCGKYRFNKHDFGDDRRSAAAARHGPVQRRLLGDPGRRRARRGLRVRVNDLPLSLMVSWFEQKAAAVFSRCSRLGSGICASARPCRRSSPRRSLACSSRNSRWRRSVTRPPTSRSALALTAQARERRTSSQTPRPTPLPRLLHDDGRRPDRRRGAPTAPDVLEAAAAGRPTCCPRSCRKGTCGACYATVREGAHRRRARTAPRRSRRAAGRDGGVLLCRTYPREPLAVALRCERLADQSRGSVPGAARTSSPSSRSARTPDRPAAAARSTRTTSAAAGVEFEPGQFVEVALPGGRPPPGVLARERRQLGRRGRAARPAPARRLVQRGPRGRGSRPAPPGRGSSSTARRVRSGCGRTGSGRGGSSRAAPAWPRSPRWSAGWPSGATRSRSGSTSG